MKSVVLKLSLPLFLLALYQEGESAIQGRGKQVHEAVNQRQEFIPYFKKLSEQLTRLKLQDSAKKINTVMTVIERNKSLTNPKKGLSPEEIRTQISKPLIEVSEDIKNKVENEDNVDTKVVQDIVSTLETIAEKFVSFSNDKSDLKSIGRTIEQINEIQILTNQVAILSKEMSYNIAKNNTRNELKENNMELIETGRKNLIHVLDQGGGILKQYISNNYSISGKKIYRWLVNYQKAVIALVKDIIPGFDGSVLIKYDESILSQISSKKITFKWDNVVKFIKDSIDVVKDSISNTKDRISNTKLLTCLQASQLAKLSIVKSVGGVEYLRICKSVYNQLKGICKGSRESDFEIIEADKDNENIDDNIIIDSTDGDLEQDKESQNKNQLESIGTSKKLDEDGGFSKLDNNELVNENKDKLSQNKEESETDTDENEDSFSAADDVDLDEENKNKDQEGSNKDANGESTLTNEGEKIQDEEGGSNDDVYEEKEISIDGEMIPIAIKNNDVLSNAKEYVEGRLFKKIKNESDTWKEKETEYTCQQMINALKTTNDNQNKQLVEYRKRLDKEKKEPSPDNETEWKTIVNMVKACVLIFKQDGKNITGFYKYGEDYVEQKTIILCCENDIYYRLEDSNELEVKDDRVERCIDDLLKLSEDSKINDIKDLKENQTGQADIKKILKQKFSNIRNIVKVEQIESKDLGKSLGEVVYMLDVISNNHSAYFYEQIKELSRIISTKDNISELKDFYNSIVEVYRSYLEDRNINKTELSEDEFDSILKNKEYTAGTNNACGFFASLTNGKHGDGLYEARKIATEELKKAIDKDSLGIVIRHVIAEVLTRDPISYIRQNEVYLTREPNQGENCNANLSALTRFIKAIAYTQDLNNSIKSTLSNTALNDRVLGDICNDIDKNGGTIKIKENDSLLVKKDKFEKALTPDLQKAFIDGILAINNIMLQISTGYNSGDSKIFEAIALMRGVNINVVSRNEFIWKGEKPSYSRSKDLEFYPFEKDKIDTLNVILESSVNSSNKSDGHFSRANKGQKIKTATDKEIQEAAKKIIKNKYRDI